MNCACQKVCETHRSQVNIVCCQVLRPLCHIQNLHFWNAVYLSDTATTALADGSVPTSAFAVDDLLNANGSEASSSSAVTSPDEQLLLPAKTRSCDDLTKAGLDDNGSIHPITSAQRRLSDSNLAAHVTSSSSEDDDVAPVTVCCESEERCVFCYDDA